MDEKTVNTKKMAIAVYARGKKHHVYRANLIKSIKKFLPEIDVLDVDPSKLFDVTKPIPYDVRVFFHKLAIPVDPKFDDYDRVVYIDCDTDVVSSDFMKIADVETSDDGLAAVPDLGQKMRIAEVRSVDPSFNKPVYVNAGLLVFDMKKIDKASWRTRVKVGVKRWLSAWRRKKPLLHDQFVINTEFDVNPIDPRFSWFASQKLPEGGAWLIHYCGHSKGRLDLTISSRHASQNLDYPVDVVYAVGQDTSDIDFAPLRWSIRSLGMHAKGIRNVIVVSERKPDWLSDEAIFVEYGNKYPGSSFKASNITLKVINGARTAGASKQFLYSSDDHFLVDNIDFREYPRYFTGRVKEFVGSRWFINAPSASKRYWLSLAKCEDYLESIGLKAWRKTCLHLNTWMCAEYLDEAEKITLAAHEKGISMSFNMLFNALFERDHKDVKFVKFWGSFDHKAKNVTGCKLKDLPGTIGFSTTDGAERDPRVVEWMENRYPVKSRWEK